MPKSKIVFDSPISKLLGEKLAMKLGLAVEVIEGRGRNEGIPRPEGQSHDVRDDSTASVDRGSAGEASKSNSMNEEWERFKRGEHDD